MKNDIICLRTFKSEKVIEYIGKINSQFGTRVPTKCAYQYCGDTSNLNIAAMFVQLTFAFDLLHKFVHHFFTWTFVHFNPVVGLDGERIFLFNGGTDIDLILAAWGAGGGVEEAKVSVNNRKE